MCFNDKNVIELNTSIFVDMIKNQFQPYLLFFEKKIKFYKTLHLGETKNSINMKNVLNQTNKNSNLIIEKNINEDSVIDSSREERNICKNYKRTQKTPSQKKDEERRKNQKKYQKRKGNLEAIMRKQENDRLYKQKKRNNLMFKDKENEKKRLIYKNQHLIEKITKNSRDRAFIQKMRLNPESKKNEAKCKRIAFESLNEFEKNKIREREALRIKSLRESRNFIIERYNKGIEEGPDYVCICCGGLFFKRTVTKITEKFSNEIKSKNQTLYNKVFVLSNKVSHGFQWFCATCFRYIIENECPRLCLNNNLHFPPIVPEIKVLNELEERLVSPRIPYLRIKPLGWDKQQGLVGNVVNVPINIQNTLNQLPRNFEQCQYIQLKFMRKYDYKKAQWENTVSRDKIAKALNFLINQSLFKELNIKIDKKWKDLFKLKSKYGTYNHNILEHLSIDKSLKESNNNPDISSDEFEEELNRSQNNNFDSEFSEEDNDDDNESNSVKSTKKAYSQIDDDDKINYDSEVDGEYNVEIDDDVNKNISKKPYEYFNKHSNKNNPEVHETLLTDNIETSIILNKVMTDMSDETHKIAPGETNHPISLIFDSNVEELTFIKIFMGQKMTPSNELTFIGKCKSFFRRFDRRCAKNIQYIFFMYKKLVAKRIFSSIELCLKRMSIQNKLTVNDVLNNRQLIEKYLKTDDAKRFLRNIRSSPEYWILRKRELFAMIRQFGKPSFFITLSPAEIDWPELILILNNLLKSKKINKEEARLMTRDKKINLLRKDPITCARYFENRMRHLINYMYNPKNGPFSNHPVTDHYWRIEFQTRGSPHVHMLVWLDQAPKFQSTNAELITTKTHFSKYVDLNKLSNDKLYKFIDDYVTCRNPNRGFVKDQIKNNDISQTEEPLNNKDQEMYDYDNYEDDDASNNSDYNDENYDSKIEMVPIKYQRHEHRHNCEQIDGEQLKFTLDNRLQSDDSSESDNDNDDDDLSKKEQYKKQSILYEKIMNYDVPKEKRKKYDKEYIKKYELTCKYNYPMPIIANTIVLEPFLDSDEIDNYQLQKNFKLIKFALILIVKKRKIQAKINKKKQSNQLKLFDISQENFLSILDLDYLEYIDSLRFSIKRTTVFIKRNCSDLMINAYNRDIYVRHKANMDIQYVIDSYGIVTYLTSYIMKSNAVMSSILNMAAAEVEQGNLTMKQKFHKIGNKFQNCSEISAQECVYNLLSMPVSHCSRESVFIMTFPIRERYNMVKDKRILETLNAQSVEIFIEGLVDHYVNRPENMENTCLADFASNFEYVSKQKYDQRVKKKARASNIFEQDELDKLDEDGFGEMMSQIDELDNEIGKITDNNENLVLGKSDTKYIRLLNNKGFLIKREKSRIIRYRRYQKRSDSENFHREQIMLFFPWRKELEESNIQNYEVFFNQNRASIDINKHQFDDLGKNVYIDEELFEREQSMIEAHYQQKNQNEAILKNKISNFLEKKNYTEFTKSNMRKQKTSEAIVGKGEETEDENDNNEEMYEDEYGYHGQIDNLFSIGKMKDSDKKQKLTKAQKRMEDDEYFKYLSCLNQKQHLYFMNMLYLIKKNEQFCHFISGGAGVGKSHLITSIYQTCLRYFGKQYVTNNKNDFDYNPEEIHKWVLLTSFTGKASFNIKGVTLHSIFRLPTLSSILPLTDANLKNVQKELKHLKLLIIDEISMVSSKIIWHIDERCRQIFENNKLFGGVSVIVLGDFNQLPPVSGHFAFENHNTFNAYSKLLNSKSNYIWDQFKLFELTEIMRQKGDPKFAEALTKIGLDGLIALNQEEIRMFDSRIRPKMYIPTDAIYLFFTRFNVGKVNEEIMVTKRKQAELLFNQTGDLNYLEKSFIFQNKIRYEREGTLKTKDVKAIEATIQVARENLTGRKKPLLAQTVDLQIGIKYMIQNNIDTNDGLANGTCGLLCQIDKIDVPTIDEDTNELEITTFAKDIWLDFYDPEIGELKRKQYPIRYANDNRILTPISTIKQTVRHNIEQSWFVNAHQFPIEPCEAMTIHKAQGATIQTLAIDIEKKNISQKALLYVALSRCRTIEGLFLFSTTGRKSIVQDESFLNYSDEKKKKIIKNNRKLNTSYQMLQFMRKNCLITNNFPFLKIDDTTTKQTSDFHEKNSYLIMFHNAGNLVRHMNSIKNDWAIKKADILFYAETHTHPDLRKYDKTKIPEGFRIHRLTGSGDPNKSMANGLVAFERKRELSERQLLRFCADNSNTVDNIPGYFEGNDITEISLHYITINRYKIYLCNVYNHPSVGKSKLFSVLIDFLKQHIPFKNGRFNEPIFIFGDFNINLKQDEKSEKLVKDIYNNYRLTSLIDQVTTDKHTQIDWILTNTNKDNLKYKAMVYESYFSDHKPLCLYIHKFAHTPNFV